MRAMNLVEHSKFISLEIGFDDMTNLLENQVAGYISIKQSQSCTADKKLCADLLLLPQHSGRPAAM
ncbi:hypothetical protein HAX54_009263, partial [Datura stramonium]|nr:hypothetical protein [Datura stramonium]